MKINLEKKWAEAIKKTKIVRTRYAKLNTFHKTVLPYVLINESCVNKSTTVIREGKVEVSPLMIHLPDGSPIFDGFNFFDTTEYQTETIKTFLLVRGIKLPSLKYSNDEIKLDLSEKTVEEVVKEYQIKLARKEDLDTGIIVGIPDVWQFSLLIYIISNITKSIKNDIKNIFDSFE
jgi:hypothetical protein